MTCFRVLIAFSRCDLANDRPESWAQVLVGQFEDEIAKRLREREFRFYPEEPGE
jgi:hypothetical protein